jgi:hypothetical protein
MPTAIRTSLNTPRGAKPADRVGTVPERLVMESRGTGPWQLQTTPARLVVQVEGEGGRPAWRVYPGLTWNQIDWAIDGEDFTATLSMPVLDLQKQQGNAPPRPQAPQHMAYFLSVFGPSRLIRIIGTVSRGKGPGSWVPPRIYHEGYAMVDSVVWPDKQQGLRFKSLSAGQEYLRTHADTQVTGRWMRGRPTEEWDPEKPDAQLVTALSPSFNPRGLPNRSARTYDMQTGTDSGGGVVTEPIHLWTTDGAPGAQHWTYWQALRALLFFWCAWHGDAVVDAHKFLLDTQSMATKPPTSSDDPFIEYGTQLVNDITVQSTTVDAALALLCGTAGLHYEIAIDTDPIPGELWSRYAANHYVRIWAVIDNAAALAATPTIARNMGTPAVHDFPRDAPWTDYANVATSDIADANAARNAQLTLDNRDVSNVHVYGGTPQWEGSFLLRPGWLPFIHLDNLERGSEAAQTAKDWWDDEFPVDAYEGSGRRPISVHHGQHLLHALYADIMRLWIFPDSDEYYTHATSYGRTTGPYDAAKYDVYHNRETAQAANWRLWYEDNTWGGFIRHGDASFGIPGVGDWVPRRRPFQNTIGRFSTATADVSPIVRIHFGVRDDDDELLLDTDGHPQVPAPDDDAWVPFAAQPIIDTDRAAIRLTEDNPHNSPPFRERPNEPYGDATGGLATRAFIDGHFWVQVTASVYGDRRMTSMRFKRGAAWPRTRHRTLDTGHDQYVRRFRRGVNGGNSFMGADIQHSDVAAYENRDDLNALDDLGGQLVKDLSGQTVAGSFTAWFRTDTYRLGDSFSGCAGLAFTWKRYPGVVRVQWINVGSVQTRVILSDLRNRPEVGAE